MNDKYHVINEHLAQMISLAQANRSSVITPEQFYHAMDTVNCLIRLIDHNAANLPTRDDIFDHHISIDANEKIQQWFRDNPRFRGTRLSFDMYNTDIFEVKMYWLNNSSAKSRIAAGVMLTPNWEDSELTHNDSYKVGIDFFVKHDNQAIIMAISKAGNLRVMEFSSHLTNTQCEILDKIAGRAQSSSKQLFHEALWNALELKEVNKKFYLGIAAKFAELYQYLERTGKNSADAKLFVSRLIGRLLFVWFLRKKGVIANEDYYFPKHIDDDTTYYNSILRKLFFNTFNTPVNNRSGGDTKTPYLNGGLFAPQDNDWPYEEVRFPRYFFTELYNHFSQYNFTTDESSPDYEQIAIDPEMLGRVFESLLAEQINEDGKQERKAKGAFYTPREIVSYMCKESLRQYLYNKLPDKKYHAGIDMLLNKSEYDWARDHSNSKRDLWTFGNADTIAKQVIKILDDLRLIDPACGSGAFPMGMMQLLIKTYLRLDSTQDPYKIKIRIMENIIYGVDIEPMAVEIARLRAWLSIVVDDKGEIDPLPNLNFKFVCADSLVPLVHRAGANSNTLQDTLRMVHHKFFNARTPESKEDWKTKYLKAIAQGSMLDGRYSAQIKSFDPFKNNHAAEFFDPKFMFDEAKFDIVIGNPPYVHLEKIKDVANAKYKPLNYQTYSARGDLYCLFFERYTEMLHDNGVLAFITSNKWLRAGYGQNLRNYFIQHTQPLILIDLGGGVFESATVDTSILILKRANYDIDTEVAQIDSIKLDNIKQLFNEAKSNMRFKLDDNWAILSPLEQSIRQKVETYGTPLKDWDIRINYGIKTGCNEAFIIDEATRDQLVAEDPKSAEIIRPVLRGRDIKHNTYTWAHLYMIVAHNGYDTPERTHVPHVEMDNYPAVKSWLISGVWNDKPQKGTALERLSIRSDRGYTPYNLRDCAYMDDFFKPKIIYSEISRMPCFYLDYSKFAISNTAYIMSGERLDCLVKYLNSAIITWIFKKYYAGGGLGDCGYRYLKAHIVNLPLPRYFVASEINENKICELFHLTTEEIEFIKNSL